MFFLKKMVPFDVEEEEEGFKVLNLKEKIVNEKFFYIFSEFLVFLIDFI